MKPIGFKHHPYIPNSVPEVEQEMLHEIGLNSLEELHEEVPDEIILKNEMNLPEAFGSEYELRRHVEKLLKKNSSCADNLNFLGLLSALCPRHLRRDQRQGRVPDRLRRRELQRLRPLPEPL